MIDRRAGRVKSLTPVPSTAVWPDRQGKLTEIRDRARWKISRN